MGQMPGYTDNPYLNDSHLLKVAKKTQTIVDMIFFYIFAIKHFVNLFINLKIA